MRPARPLSLFIALLALWALAPILDVLAVGGELPSLFVMPLVALVAGALAPSPRAAAVEPALALVPVLAGYAVLASVGTAALVVMFLLHAVPVAMAAAGVAWLRERRLRVAPVPA